MLTRSIPKHPDVPPLTDEMIQALGQLCFVPVAPLTQPLNGLMVFGTGHWYREISDYLAMLIPRLTFRHRVIVITGGMPQFEDSAQIQISESQLIYDYLQSYHPSVLRDFTIHLEHHATNTTENIVNSLPRLSTLQPGDRLGYVMKAYASGRTLYALRRWLPGIEFANYSTNYDHKADPESWMRDPAATSRVRGEYLRIVEYSKIGNLDVSEVRALLEKI